MPDDDRCCLLIRYEDRSVTVTVTVTVCGCQQAQYGRYLYDEKIMTPSPPHIDD